MTSSHGKHTYREIKTQSRAWEATLNSIESQTAGAVEWLRQPRAETLFTGCGSTYYLSLAAAAVWQTLTGRRARGIPASELWLFPEPSLPNQPSMLVAVSRSGETTETLRALEVYRQRAGSDILGITVYRESELARRASQVITTRDAEEQSVAQTRSFTGMYLLAQAVAGLAAGRKEFLAELHKLPQAFESVIAAYEPLAKKLAGDQRFEQFIFLGSGPNYGLACEAMLKMKEMSLSPSEAFHYLEFRHGPKSVVTSKTLLVGLLSDPVREQEVRVLDEMRAVGASVLALAESTGGMQMDYTIELHSGIEYLGRGALYLPVLQLLAYYRAINKGLDPDQPANLESVVILP